MVQRVLEGEFLGAFDALGPVVAVAAKTDHELLRRNIRKTIADRSREPVLRGNRPGLVVRGVFVIGHQDQIIIGLGKALEVEGPVVDRNRLRNEQSVSVEDPVELFHECQKAWLGVPWHGLKVDADSLVAALMHVGAKVGDEIVPAGGIGEHGSKPVRVPVTAVRVIDERHDTGARVRRPDKRRYLLLTQRVIVLEAACTVGKVQPFGNERVDGADVSLQRHEAVVIPIDEKGDPLEVAADRALAVRAYGLCQVAAGIGRRSRGVAWTVIGAVLGGAGGAGSQVALLRQVRVALQAEGGQDRVDENADHKRAHQHTDHGTDDERNLLRATPAARGGVVENRLHGRPTRVVLPSMCGSSGAEAALT